MPHLPEDTKIENWHRYFAMEANNRAWSLASQPKRTDAEAREMLDLAHTSAMHWAQVGTEQNTVRAKYLVAEVHALTGSGQYAHALIQEVVDFFDPADLDDWELAYICTIQAHALSLVGSEEAKTESYQRAQQAVAAVSDPEDRKIVEQTFIQVPKP